MLVKGSNFFEGVRSWPWYWNTVSNAFTCLNRVSSECGNLLVLGNPVLFGRSKKRLVIALGEEANRQVFSQPDIYKPTGQVVRGPRDSAHRRLRVGILAMHGDKHRRHRKAMQPPFSKPAVATYVPTITKLIDQVLDRWVIGESFDMYQETTMMANWIAGHVLFDHHDFEKSVQMSQLISDWFNLDIEFRKAPLPIDIGTTRYARLLRHAEVLEKTIGELISTKRREPEPGNDVLSVLIHTAKVEGVDISDIDLAAHAVILHAAAYITTASALAWTMYLIAQNPETAISLSEEINTNITNWPPDAKQVEKLPLLDGILRESLRMMPPVHHTIRSATEETELLGVPLRPGDNVVVSGYITHRDPAIFDNPNRFDPTRWFDQKPGPYQYIPFSAGPRLCLGYQFAMLEMKLIIVRVMQRFRLNVVPNSLIQAECQLTLRPAKGLMMVASKPDGAFSKSPVKGNINELFDDN